MAYGSNGGSPYSFIPGVNDYAAKLSADKGIAGITGMNPNQVENMASGHNLGYWQHQQTGMPSYTGYGGNMAPTPYGSTPATEAQMAATGRQVPSYMMDGGTGGGNDQSGGIAGLYQQYLGRAPDAGGLDFYKQQLGSGMSMGDLAYEFQHSPEYLSQHPSSTSSATGGYGASSNPYLGGQADAIGTRAHDFLNDALNQIRDGAVATGGYGGSRQGVAQGIATSKASDYLTGNLANLYGQDWNAAQNRGLQQYGMDQNFYTGQRGQDLQQQGIGATLYGLGQQGQWSNLQNLAQILGNYTGFGTTSGGTSQGGGGVGALGGAGAGYQLFKGLFS